MGALVSKVWQLRPWRAAQPQPPRDDSSIALYDERGRRPRPATDVRAGVLFRGNRQIGKSALIARTFHGMPARHVMTKPYMPTAHVDFAVYREPNEVLQVWDSTGDKTSRMATSPVIMRRCALVVICFSMSDADALERIADHLHIVRIASAAGDCMPVLLLGLRGDEPRAVTLDDVCEFAARNRVRCFGSDVAALPIAYDDWAAGAVPAAADAGRPARVHVAGASSSAASASASASSVASEYWSSEAAQRVDWRAVFQRRAPHGIATICRAPVIEFSSAAATDEQAAWLAHLLHDLTVENSLMDTSLLQRDAGPSATRR